MYLMQSDGNLTKVDTHPGVLVLLNPWTQLGMFFAICVTSSYSINSIIPFYLRILRHVLQVGHICCRFEFKTNEMACFAIP